MDSSVDIAFDCLPLRLVGRIDVPLDASDAARTRVHRVTAAIDRFGRERTYFLDNAHYILRLVNSGIEGMIRFAFWGTVVTDAGDARVNEVKLEAELVAETCGGVPEHARDWLIGVMHRAVAIEFERYIAAGQRDRDAAEIENAGEDYFARGV